MTRSLGTALVFLALGTAARAQVPEEAELAARKLKAAPGLKVGLFAAEPQLANPVSFCFDEKGRVYVAETHRLWTSVFDIRKYPDWLDDDLACRTVEDRIAMHRKHLGAKAGELAVASERVRLIEDRDGDGRADQAVTFAEGFNTLADGTAAGVLARKEKVWFANIPNLWILTADSRKALHTGYGVRQAFIGHDLHGLTFGPDGKLYFSIGDRGLHVKTERGIVDNPDTGAVLRCNPDGSDLELFAVGLRNPQELAFDNYGNLWTGDNNCDGGDAARWVYVVEGGDSGWRIGYQPMPDRGPWNREGLWKLDAATTAPYLVPPIAHIGHGPAGLVFNPGAGLPPEYDDHFFLCDFPGRVLSFAVKPKGAAYELVDLKEFLTELRPTDVDFGPDGAVYVLDWVEGWEMTGKGRIFRVSDPSRAKDPPLLQTRELIAEGMEKRAPEELARLLAHRDRRVRQAAQFELAERKDAATLSEVAAKGTTQLARLHAIWGLGQTGHSKLGSLLRDDDPEVRAQAAKVLGDLRAQDAFERLLGLLRDPAPRVRFFAAAALGKLGRKEAVAPLFEMLKENADRDAFLRHAGVTALARIGDVDALLRAGRDESVPVRLASLLALRRLERPEIRMFLEDKDASLVFEAARAIHDVPIPAAMPALAEMLGKSWCPEKAISRAINARFRSGKPEDAKALAEFARQKKDPEALRALADWERPSGRDRVMGLWRPLAPGDPKAALEAVKELLTALLKESPDPVRAEAIRAAAALGLSESGDLLDGLARNAGLSAHVRVEAIKGLVQFKDPRATAALLAALEDRDNALRREVVRMLPKVKVPDAVPFLEKLIVEETPIPIQQAAVTSLGELEADEALGRLWDRLFEGKLPAALHLDLIEASEKRPALQGRLKSLHEPPYPVALEGGDAEEGRKIFFEHQGAGCLKCHKIGDKGGDVGPALTMIGAQRTRAELLESIVLPNKVIAEGYGQTLLKLKEDVVEVGRVESENEGELMLLLSDGTRKKISKSLIEARKPGMSAMPEDAVQKLTKRQLRDLIAFLAGLK